MQSWELHGTLGITWHPAWGTRDAISSPSQPDGLMSRQRTNFARLKYSKYLPRDADSRVELDSKQLDLSNPLPNDLRQESYNETAHSKAVVNCSSQEGSVKHFLLHALEYEGGVQLWST